MWKAHFLSENHGLAGCCGKESGLSSPIDAQSPNGCSLSPWYLESSADEAAADAPAQLHASGRDRGSSTPPVSRYSKVTKARRARASGVASVASTRYMETHANHQGQRRSVQRQPSAQPFESDSARLSPCAGIPRMEKTLRSGKVDMPTSPQGYVPAQAWRPRIEVLPLSTFRTHAEMEQDALKKNMHGLRRLELCNELEHLQVVPCADKCADMDAAQTSFWTRSKHLGTSGVSFAKIKPMSDESEDLIDQRIAAISRQVSVESDSRRLERLRLRLTRLEQQRLEMRRGCMNSCIEENCAPIHQ
ncbi:hypothetical protein FVE85_1980 [Porphyridium purpureum]|uniref:Uncharacterized protein n=1 Tax=Porphyridium purpureum TaxID=35688 RepID=A0A5J4YXF1_PORPP|nr:hypothetical protein FVE85_1980 [Porphyridium purpureum]|eukprot:POR8487..scf209_3